MLLESMRYGAFQADAPLQRGATEKEHMRREC
jgi:hypothetical protein